MRQLLNKFFDFWQIIPNTYIHLAPRFWAEEEKRNRYRAQVLGVCGLILLLGLSLVDVFTQPSKMAIPLAILNGLLLLVSVVLALNQRFPFHYLPVYTLFCLSTVMNIIVATIAAVFLLDDIVQLLMVLFLMAAILLIVPGFSYWFLAPTILMPASYIFVSNRLNLPDSIAAIHAHILVVLFLLPIMIVLINRAGVKQRWEVFLNQFLMTQINEQLQQQTADLEGTNGELQTRNAELDAFAHTVAHDLKNPLTIVVGYAEFLCDDLMDGGDPRWLDFTQQIIIAGRKANDIIQELLLLAAVRKEDIVVTPLAMGVIVQQALERLSHSIEENNVELLQPAQWPTALGYAGWVEEVWVNYIGNAIKYGGEPCRVELGVEMLPNDCVRYWVKDNGAGLSPAEQDMLFREFTRLDKKRADGHGLGLSIVRRIMKKLNGRVGIKSEVGKGSIFYFELPTQVVISEGSKKSTLF